MNRNETSRRGLAFRALALSLLVTGCGNAPRQESTVTTTPPPSAPAYKPHLETAQALQDRYAIAGVARDRYEECMGQYFPNYREHVAEYGEVALGGEDSGMPEHPSLEGCRAEREEADRLTDIAMGRQGR